MTKPTLERAARALAFTSYKSEADDYPDTFLEDYSGATPEQLVERFWRDWLPETRAVLMAVRNAPEVHHHEDGRAIFAAMIDAILNDGEGE